MRPTYFNTNKFNHAEDHAEVDVYRSHVLSGETSPEPQVLFYFIILLFFYVFSFLIF